MPIKTADWKTSEIMQFQYKVEDFVTIDEVAMLFINIINKIQLGSGKLLLTNRK